MAVRIVHFGSDTFNRVAALKSTGYSVDVCLSLAQLHASLVGLLPIDAVVIAENVNDGIVQNHAISLVRSVCAAPLILFLNGNHSYHRGEFDLVIPFDEGTDEWLNDITDLVVRTFQRVR